MTSSPSPIPKARRLSIRASRPLPTPIQYCVPQYSANAFSNASSHTAVQFKIKDEKIAEEEKYDGFYCVATNLEDEVSEIIKTNKKRWEIEESFKIMKTEFSARPVYLSRNDRITAHFTTCFLALVLFRFFEKGMGNKYTCEQLLDGLKSVKFLKTQEGYLPAFARTDLTDDLHDLFGKSTDYEITTFGDMKKIISFSKKVFHIVQFLKSKNPTNARFYWRLWSFAFSNCQRQDSNKSYVRFNGEDLIQTPKNPKEQKSNNFTGTDNGNNKRLSR